jgi:hypothetical protein
MRHVYKCSKTEALGLLCDKWEDVLVRGSVYRSGRAATVAIDGIITIVQSGTEFAVRGSRLLCR